VHAASVREQGPGKSGVVPVWEQGRDLDKDGTCVKGKCALGPFLSILVIECQHKCLNVNQCPWMNKVKI
jgi:hypothetical protein